jgi:hypothetical protein
VSLLAAIWMKYVGHPKVYMTGNTLLLSVLLEFADAVVDVTDAP